MMIDVLRPLVVHTVGEMDRATSNGNEAKSKMKHTSDMHKPRVKLRC